MQQRPTGRFLIQSALLFVIGTTVVLTAHHFQGQTDPAFPTRVCDLHFSSGQVLAGVPVAETPAQRAKGLSKRNDVGLGMLFTWERSEPQMFWMRDTWVPLTIGFFDDGGRLFSIQDMQPNSDDLYESIQPVANALELPHGDFQRYGLQEGEYLTKHNCTELSQAPNQQQEAS